MLVLRHNNADSSILNQRNSQGDQCNQSNPITIRIIITRPFAQKAWPKTMKPESAKEIRAYCNRPTRINTAESSDLGAFCFTMMVTFGCNTPLTAVERFVNIELNVTPTLYTAIAAVLASMPKITLSVAQNNISTIEPIKTYRENPKISVISRPGIF